LSKNANNNIVVQLGADIAMTGATSIVCDGQVPTNIIVTLDSGSASPLKAKLFVDGMLEDTHTGSTYVTTSSDFVVGGVYSASYPGTTGMIEEVVLYNKAYEVVEESGEYIFNTQNILDLNGAGTRNIAHNARLIAADYHNFRGPSAQEIGMTNQVGWRATTL